MLANSSAQDQVAGARSGVLNGATARQRGFDQEANGFNTASTDGYSNTSGKMDDRAKTVSDYYKTQNGGLPTSGPTTGVIPPSSSNIVNQDAKAQGAKVAAYSGQQDNALGRLRSFGDILGGEDRNTALNTAQVGTINSFKKGDAALTPLFLENANNAGNGTKLFGDILGGLGKAAMFAGLSGAGAGMFGDGMASGATLRGLETQARNNLAAGAVI